MTFLAIIIAVLLLQVWGNAERTHRDGWLAGWQGRHPPRIEHTANFVFAGNHGITDQGVSAYPASVTAAMVESFEAGGAAINQLARIAGAELHVVPLRLDRPTRDFTMQPAMDEVECISAFNTGLTAPDRLISPK